MARCSRSVRIDPTPIGRAARCVIEQLELRRMLCQLGVDDSGPEAHLYDTNGKHLNLAATIPDPSRVDTFPNLVGPMKKNVALGSAAAMGAEETLDGSSNIVAPASGALNGKIAYVNAGHGWTWTGSAWLTQRPEYQEIVEDFQTQDQITYYADYMLRAGATVVPTRPLGHQLNELIVDNNDAGFSIVSGSWTTNTASSTYWSNANGADTNNRYRFANVSATETAVARWTPNIAQAGFYPVYAWWANGPNRSTEALYRINSGGGSVEVKVNQRYTGKGWVYLGMHYFDAGAGGNVELSNKASNGSAVIADAIRFGNGMGDFDSGGGISGKPREEELSLYWLYRSRGYTGSGAIVAASTVDGGNSSDNSAGIVGPPRWISYMNDETQGTNLERLHLSFHSNGSTGLPDAAARGTEGLLNNTVANQTINQNWWANEVGNEVEEDMQALPAGMIEHTWASRNNVYGSNNYGEINENNLDAFNSDPAQSEMAATILEVAFHDNLQDSQNMRNPKVRDWTARAAYQAAAKYFNNLTATTVLPEPPGASRATTDASGNITLNWSAPATGAAAGGASAATGYKILYGQSAYAFSDSITLGNVTSHTFPAGTFPAGAMMYFKIVATNVAGESAQRDVVAAKTQAGRRAPILIVNGYDRFDRTTDDTQGYGASGIVDRVRFRYQNTRDYVWQFGEAIEAYNAVLGVETAQNDQVISGTVNLNDFHTVLWISGEEATTDETFNASERSLLTTFINNGGKLFTSGSEIGWHLDQGGADPAFYNNVLRANYSADDANSYSTTGVAGSIFNGLTAVNFDNGADALPAGSFNTYDVEAADVLTTINGSTAALTYSTGGVAAVQWAGPTAKVVTMGFPFETITSSTKRNQVMSGVLTFFNVNSTTTPSTPNTPNLANANDSGQSNTDDRTFYNNSGGLTLTLQVTGTEAGVYVRLYDGATMIGEQLATGTTTIVTTDNVNTLADGPRPIVARQWDAVRGESGPSAPLNLTIDTAAPAAPGSSNVSTTSSSIALDWPSNAEGDLWGYNIYRSATAGGPYTKINGATPVTVSNYTDSPLGVAETYYYVARAVDTAGNESGNSSEASGTTTGGASATPGLPNLVDGSDSGSSSSDDKTYHNNGTNALQFLVSGTVAGALVKIYADGIEIGSATASGSSTNVVTTGAVADGVVAITATQTDGALPESAPSATLNITVDSTAPVPDIPAPGNPAGGAAYYSFTVQFTESLSGLDAATLDDNDIIVTGPNGYSESAEFVSVVGNDVTYRIPGPGGQWNVADGGGYMVHVQANQVKDIAGNSTAAVDIGELALNVPFAWMSGDELHVDMAASASTVIISVNGSDLELNDNGPTTLSFPAASVDSIDVIGSAGDNLLDINGNVTQPLTFTGGGGNDEVAVIAGSFTFGSDFGLTAPGLTISVAEGASAVFNSSQHLSQLIVGGTLAVAPGDSKVVVVEHMLLNGRIDLADNDLIWNYEGASPLGSWGGSSYSGAIGFVQSGRGDGSWNGATGIVTSMSDATTSLLTTIAVAEAADLFGLGPTDTATFSGETVDATAILFKYTWGGDADMNGELNGDDYFFIDSNIVNSGSVFGYTVGDFDLNGEINGDDYFIIDGNMPATGGVVL